VIGSAALAVLAPAGSGADTTGPIDFEAPTYEPGSIDDQGGWGGDDAPIDEDLDQEVVTLEDGPAAFGAQAFRMSNAFASGTFFDQIYSPATVDEAGETDADASDESGGDRQTRFVAELQVTSAAPDIWQEGLNVGISPDRGDGSRMGLIRVHDDLGGLSVHVWDFRHSRNTDDCSGAGFTDNTVVTGLDRAEVHTIRVVIDFVDGIENDVAKTYVDGELVHVGTTWEDFYRDCLPPDSVTVDSLLFRVNGASAEETDGDGFLFDNVQLHTGPTPTCLGERVTVELGAGDTPTSGDDVVAGTSGPDVVDAGAGDDRVCSYRGADDVTLGAGADRALGGNNADVVRGGPGADDIQGGNGQDDLRGSGDTDTLAGDSGRDTVSGGPGADGLDGGTHRDACSGGTGVDTAQNCEVTSAVP
jgi:Ca2+-binding RTX toxin-like protein